MLQHYFADLHIHVGRNIAGKPVKITASKNLTITNILNEASKRKGIDLIGVIDCQAPLVLKEIDELIANGLAYEKRQGGIKFKDTTLILGSEIEIYDASCQGPIHVLCYFPFLDTMREFSQWLRQHMKNIELSSQRFYGTARSLQEKVKQLDGLFIPAHIFTPFKSLYGKGVKASLTEVLDPERIDAIEVGLSADTHMANQISELHHYTFLTNSDAHSIAKIAREYQLLQLEEPSFAELKQALYQQNGRKVVTNFGMNPRLGKYYLTVCANCLTSLQGDVCQNCGSSKSIRGVRDRINELTDNHSERPDCPLYRYQVPLEYLPSLGPKTMEKLLQHFGTEMNIIHHVPEEQLQTVVPLKLAKMIVALRHGKLSIQEGGGGRYGRIMME
ncbi:endonuclease Q family protein [Gracilibacillus alcaliphilus]|uniref:endonuclease Q family protein n=1 Tax=Gracilibacillus alcaliphilus TaxID=1401441 RepID=UPI00195DCA36|nr:endonuclease Q family protein [Gracilibacillus alcaliphilus]